MGELVATKNTKHGCRKRPKVGWTFLAVLPDLTFSISGSNVEAILNIQWLVMDYNATSEVLEFTAAGEQCVSIPINMDGVLEEEGEQFTVVLTTRDDAIRIGQQFATVTIMESDGV